MGVLKGFAREAERSKDAMGGPSASGEVSRCLARLFLTGEKGLDVDASASTLTARGLDLEVDKSRDAVDVEGREGSRGGVLGRSA